MDKYRNKYRIPSARAQWWNYGWDAAYFVTIVTKNRKCVFGDISDDVMVLSPFGQIADSCWLEIPDHAKNVQLGPYVIMPNHVHGIVILTGNCAPWKISQVDDGAGIPDRACVETTHALSLPMGRTDHPARTNDPGCMDDAQRNTGDGHPKTIGQLRFQKPGKNTISTIVGGFKSAVSNEIHKRGHEFAWQSRFHDHIIRDADEYDRIAKYIVNNPAQWAADKFFGF